MNDMRINEEGSIMTWEPDEPAGKPPLKAKTISEDKPDELEECCGAYDSESGCCPFPKEEED